jgi:hypothetical protein
MDNKNKKVLPTTTNPLEMCVLVLAYEIMEDSSTINFAQLQL